jgi:pepF/M3 family oligoendopeptidase
MCPTKTDKVSPAPAWDMDVIFPGGSKSEEFKKFLTDLKKNLKAYSDKVTTLPEKLNDSNRPQWIEMFVQIQQIRAHLIEAMAFAHCLTSQNVNDEKAHQIFGETIVLESELEKLMVSLEAFAKNQSDEEWSKLVSDSQIGEAAFFLNRMRDLARKKMPPEHESLAADLAVNGYHAWNNLYDKMYGDLRADFVEDGETKKLSIGQLANKMAVADRDIRRQAFEKLEESWESVASLASMTLNYLIGFRLSLYKNRKWDSFLFETLNQGKISEATLEAMWSSIKAAVPKLKPYVDAKKKLCGIDRFCWYDQYAPVGATDKTYSFKEAGKLIVKHIKAFSPSQADFTQMALDKRWIEAEDRPGKAGGGYHTSFPVSKESRIFMTFSGNYSELATLAHELGHAYHSRLLKDKPMFARSYPMTLAESASNFNEHLIRDAVFESSTDPNEKLMLLDQNLQEALQHFCNLRARFIFESEFYKERKGGLVSRTRMDELMIKAQEEAFGGMLDPEQGYHKLFWASKLHFYLSDISFYNFPYAFGFLFSGGVYRRAKEEGSGFDKTYQALLADTGQMTSEDLAKKYLGVDLTTEQFWNEAIELSLKDVEPFTALADKMKD